VSNKAYISIYMVLVVVVYVVYVYRYALGGLVALPFGSRLPPSRGATVHRTTAPVTTF
jgi:hypothetical protein